MAVAAPHRSDYRYFMTLQTRWADNDMFGHLNNVLYYRFFEAVVVQFVTEAGLSILHGPVLTFAAESLCRFHRPLKFPDVIEAAMRVDHMGRTSARYALALFRQGEDVAAADGHWVHVFVDRDSERPVPIPPAIRDAFERIR